RHSLPSQAIPRAAPRSGPVRPPCHAWMTIARASSASATRPPRRDPLSASSWTPLSHPTAAAWAARFVSEVIDIAPSLTARTANPDSLHEGDAVNSRVIYGNDGVWQ